MYKVQNCFKIQAYDVTDITAPFQLCRFLYLSLLVDQNKHFLWNTLNPYPSVKVYAYVSQ